MSIRFGFVSTYPPTHCGIATFSNSLMRAISDLDSHSASIVRLLDPDAKEGERGVAPEILANLRAEDPQSMAHAIAELNKVDIALIQHEFGIYGGIDGEEVLELLQGLHTPSIVVVHTVLKTPTWHQRIIFTRMTRIDASAGATATT